MTQGEYLASSAVISLNHYENGQLVVMEVDSDWNLISSGTTIQESLLKTAFGIEQSENFWDQYTEVKARLINSNQVVIQTKTDDGVYKNVIFDIRDGQMQAIATIPGNINIHNLQTTIDTTNQNGVVTNISGGNITVQYHELSNGLRLVNVTVGNDVQSRIIDQNGTQVGYSMSGTLLDVNVNGNQTIIVTSETVTVIQKH